MGNLIKYEWRKQRMTRILILACLLAFVVLFVAGAVLRNDTLVAISILIMTFCGNVRDLVCRYREHCNFKPGSKDETELYALDGAALYL